MKSHNYFDMLRLAALLALCALQAACGGGGDGPTKPPESAPCTPVAQVTIQLFGDSTQAGYEGGAVPSALAVHTPAVALQQALDARFGAGKTLVTSRAVNGTWSQELRDGTDGLNAPWPQSVTANIAVINHGINDMQRHDFETVSDYRANLEFFAANTNGAQIVFETPNNVVYGATGTTAYAQTMREVATEFHDPVADTNALTDLSILGDWAHPTDAGYIEVVSRSLAPAVIPLAAKLLCR